MGGENKSISSACRSAGGSSPRGRGKRACPDPQRLEPGLIPAWAGKTTRAACRPRGTRAHPRVGGENYPTEESSGTASGSSPRGRGKLLDGVDDDAGPGLIPAWAGKTTPPRSPRPPARAHPRVGGENIVDRIKPALTDGSSPRGRGKLALTSHAERSAGLIPAWAGKTQACPPFPKRPWAHPRVGGENRYPRINGDKAGGSSPRGRGKLELDGL